MYLKNLHITNFRCFADYEIEFAPRVTVLFGKNGSGKTTLIHAIHKALSFMMYSDKVYKTEIVKGKKKKVIDTVRTITNKNKYLHPETISTDDCHDSKVQISEICVRDSSLDNDTNLPDWKISVFTNNGRLRTSEFMEAFDTFINWHERTGKLPLLAYYSDSFPHVEEHKNGKTKKPIRYERNFGYHDWNEEVGCTNEWLNRLEGNYYNIYQTSKRLKQYKQTPEAEVANRDAIDVAMESKAAMEKENNAIMNCLSKFSSFLTKTGGNTIDIVSFADEGELTIYTSKGEAKPFRQLPAGYKRLFCLVLDLAFRSYILSEGECTDMPGLVIIDEVDLHLHPELEQVVLQSLTDTFPNTQFIVSTHSALALTDLETKEGKNRVIKMSPDLNSPVEWHNIHGIDYNQMLEENMDVSKRKPEIEAMFKKAWDAVAAKNVESADKAVEELESVTPKDQTELVKLRAIISRIKIIGR